MISRSTGHRCVTAIHSGRLVMLLALLAALGLTGALQAEDLVEFLSGARVAGKVKAIRKDDREFDFEVQIGGRTFLRTYPYDQVQAVTISGKRHVFNEPASGGGQQAGNTAQPATRSRAEVDRLIKEAGKSPPDWFDATPLQYPPSLELDWPLKPADKQWNNQKNVGQYIWDIINPNPGRWRGGIKLMHHITSLHKSEPALLKRDMEKLGFMYFELFQDYPRAAFWFEKANSAGTTLAGVLLAECYWRLGSQELALETLQGRTVHPQAIKLLGAMGETARALRLAESYARSQPHQAYLLAGDVCRLAGRYDDSIAYYQKVLDAPDARNAEYEQLFAARARESIEAIRLFEQADVSRVADGTHTATSTGYNGKLEVAVTVAGGRIEKIEVMEHEEKQFYSALTDTPNQIIDKQSVTGIDATSRATITSQAVVNAAAKALASGKK